MGVDYERTLIDCGEKKSYLYFSWNKKYVQILYWNVYLIYKIHISQSEDGTITDHSHTALQILVC